MTSASLAWQEAIDQRDADGNLTKLALALDSISGNGCDCGEDEPGTCMACLCESALHEQFTDLYMMREKVRSLEENA